MSNKALNHVWQHSKLKGSALILLLAIADMANDDGECWPGKANLAKKCRVKTAQLTRLIQDCERAGELAVIMRLDRKRKLHSSNIYIIPALSDAPRIAQARKPTAKKERKGVVSQNTPGGIPGETTPGIPGETTLVYPDIPITPIEPSIEPKKQNCIAPEEKGAKPARPRDPYFDVIAKYWQLPDGQVGQIKKLMMGGYTPTGDRKEDKRNAGWIACNDLFHQKPMTPAEIDGFVDWYYERNGEISLPLKAEKITTWVYKFRLDPDHDQYVVIVPDPTPTPSGDSQPDDSELFPTYPNPTPKKAVNYDFLSKL